MDLFDVILAKKMSGGSGGGGSGSSDFSTAQVTIIADSSDTIDEQIQLDNVFWSDEGIISPVIAANVESNEYTVVLYRNQVLLNEYGVDVIKSTSGAIEVVEEGQYAITGDCSITVKQFALL